MFFVILVSVAVIVVIVIYFRSSMVDSISVAKKNKEIAEKNKELAFINDTLKNTSSEKDNMVSVVAHDLRSPLGNIEGLANLVKNNGNLDKENIQYLDLIVETASKARTTIDNLLDIHKITTDVSSMRLVRQNYLVLIADVLRSFEHSAKQKNIEIELEELVRIKELNTDKEYFKRIFSNLIDNAIKYSPENEKVVVLITENENTIRFDITNFGPVMDEATRKRLYTTNVVEDEKGHRRVAGYGLSITRNLVEKLTGKISYDSSEEEGTTFSVEFFKK